MAPTLPPFAPFPAEEWRGNLSSDDWESLLASWTQLCHVYLTLQDAELGGVATKDESLPQFLSSLINELAKEGQTAIGSSSQAKALFKTAFLLTRRLWNCSKLPDLLRWEFLADFAKTYGKRRASTLFPVLFQTIGSRKLVEGSLAALKKFFIANLDAGFKGDIKTLEEHLARFNHLAHASPDVAVFFLAGADFLDGLITCFKIMNPPLRGTIIATTYLCLMGLTDGGAPSYSMLSDQLYSLKAAADAHRSGLLNVNDSLVVHLVTATPILKQIRRRADESGAATSALRSRLAALEAFHTPGLGSVRPKRLPRRMDKGKSVAIGDNIDPEAHINRASGISQVQDLFPELGSGFVAKLLDEYNQDSEQVIAHLLDESLPLHLATGDRSEQMYGHSFIVHDSYLLTLPLGLLIKQTIPTWHLVLHRPSLPNAITCTTEMNSTLYRSTCPDSILERETREKQQMTCLTIAPMLQTRRPYYLHLQHLIPMTMNATTRMTPPT